MILRRLTEHPDAPRWNHAAGDRLDDADRAAVIAYDEALAAGRGPRAPGEVPPVVLARLAPWLGDRSWEELPTTSREDLVLRVEQLLPPDVDLTRLIVYRTAGTTGHATLVPHHPRAAACYLPLVAHALARHGVALSPTHDTVGCINVGAQARTVTYPCVLTAWGGTGFAKINLRETEWPREGAARRWLPDMAPTLLTGDPISFAELARQEVPVRPRAMLTTAVALSDAVRVRLVERFGCPVVDWYSLTETGPVAVRCVAGGGFHVLPHDLHVEVVGPDGRALRPGERGEVTVSGGRNPYLPLRRYRTGDWARLAFDACACGDPMPRLLDLEGRAPVLFRAADGGLVNPVDLARLMREHPLVQHELEQRPDRSLRLRHRVLPGERLAAERLRAELASVLGPLPIELVEDPTLGERGEKVFPWKGLALLEE